MWKNKLPLGSNQIDTGKESECKKYFFFGYFFLEKEKCKDWNKNQVTFDNKAIINRSSESKTVGTGKISRNEKKTSKKCIFPFPSFYISNFSNIFFLKKKKVYIQNNRCN